MIKNSILFLFTISLISCGGGEGSSSLEVEDPITSSNQQISETCSLYEGTTYKCEFTHKGLERFYFIQDKHPEATGSSSVLFVLHGYGGTAANIMNYSNFKSYTYTKDNNFMSIFPQGSPYNSALASSISHWNSGGWTSGSNVDDVDFIDTIITLVSQKYNINNDRIYSTGMSNGGFMSYHLACNLSTKIAAIASVTGSMTDQTYDNCNPSHPTSIMQIHGSLDNTVPYNGNSSLGMKAIDDVVEYWVNYNACNPLPSRVITDYFSLEVSVDRQTYEQCLNDVQVDLVYIEGMGHTWPTSNWYGINATDYIWNFVNTYDINGKLN